MASDGTHRQQRGDEDPQTPMPSVMKTVHVSRFTKQLPFVFGYGCVYTGIEDLPVHLVIDASSEHT